MKLVEIQPKQALIPCVNQLILQVIKQLQSTPPGHNAHHIDLLATEQLKPTILDADKI